MTICNAQYKIIAANLLSLAVFGDWTIAIASDDMRARAALIYVIDGDTFRAHIQGVQSPNRLGYRIRVAGIDTPEIKGQCAYEKRLAQKAKEAARTLLTKTQQIELTNLRAGYYEKRIVADVWVDGVNLADELIRQGLGRRYIWGKRRGWCQ